MTPNLIDSILESSSVSRKPRSPSKKSPPPAKKPVNPSDPLGLREGLPPGAVLTGTQEAIEMRRRHVQKLMGLGYGPTTIAKALGVSRVTISKDFSILRKESVDRSRRGDDENKISEHLLALAAIEASAQFDYTQAEEGSSERNSLLQTALRARMAQMKLHIDSGVIEKAADKLVTETDIKTIENMEPAELKERLKELREQAEKLDEE